MLPSSTSSITRELVSAGTGHKLPADVRAVLERGLGADLSAMRVHTSPAAERLARQLGADAFTCGAEVFFRAGTYRPGTREGLRLLAHEAAHVIQQASSPAGRSAGGLSVSVPGDQWEQEADRCADRVLTGQANRGPVHPAARPGLSRAVQRHVSFEHRLLGDGPTSDLVAVSTGGSGRSEFLQNQINLVSLWRDKPDQVTEEEVSRLCPWIRTLRLGPDRVLVTYGELNALPDYLANGAALDSVDREILIATLQVIRQEGYNHLTMLLNGTNPNVTFTDAAYSPFPLSLVNTLTETGALDTMTIGLGQGGQDHYQGLLARNACHFAPFSWYRWQASHLVARDLARQAYEQKSDELARRAWVFHGYADHFLQDSFAAGHLVNKTLVMQWFIEWAASRKLLPVADWDAIKGMTTGGQPRLSGQWLYDPAYQGPSNDPQTVQEAASLVSRVLASEVSAADLSSRFAVYQNYLTFLTSAAAQLGTASLHDYYNGNSLWVSSIAHPAPYEVWGDDTLLSGPNGGNGVQATSETAQISQQALKEIIGSGTTSITTERIRQQFPTKAGSSSGSLQDLSTWAVSQRAFCEEQFGGFVQELETILLDLASPRLGVVSQDQNLASVWSSSLRGSGYHPVNTLTYSGRLFAGANGYVYELDPGNGKVLHRLLVTSSVGIRDYETRLATDGTTLFAGVDGYAYAVRLSDWSRAAWSTSLPRAGYNPVSTLVSGPKLLAGANGYVYELDPATGQVLHSLLLSSSVGAGDYDTRLAIDGTTLFAGVHGYAYGVRLSDWSRAAWSTSLPGGGYHPVSTLAYSGRLLAGANGYVYEVDPANGKVLHHLLLTSSVGVGDYETRLAIDGTTLFAGVHGYAYGVLLSDWSRAAWSTSLPWAGYNPVSTLVSGAKLVAGSNGRAYDLDPATGQVLHSLLLTSVIGVGDYDTRLACDQQAFYAGVHGYAYKVLVRANDIPPSDSTLFHNWQDTDGNWHGWVPDFDGAPKMQSVSGLIGASRHAEVYGIGTDSTLYHDWQDTDGNWHGWVSNFDGAPKMQSVSGLIGASGHAEVYGIGTDSTLYHDWQDTDGSWHGWVPNFNGAPKMQSVSGLIGASRHAEIFAIFTAR